MISFFILRKEYIICYNKYIMRQKVINLLCYILCLSMVFIISSSFLFNFIPIVDSKNLDFIRETEQILVKFRESKVVNLIKIAQTDDFYKILDDYNKIPEVDYAEPNYLYHASIIPSDTYFDNQWYLKKIKATEAWDIIRESPKVTIAILDSGVQIDHPDLVSNIWKNKKEIEANGIDDDKNGFIDDINGWDFVNEVAEPTPKFMPDYTEAGIMHGTIIAGIAAASGNNAAGISGVTWQAKIMPLKVLNDKGQGNTLKVVKAIDYAIANGADIINLSFIGFGYSKSLDDAIKRAYDAGLIIVAAGGNEQEQGEGYYLDQTPMYPICHDGFNGENRVIGVAATDTMDQKAVFSSFGKCIDISSPGLSVFSTIVYSPNNSIDGKFFNKYYDGYWSGTSVAVPMVSASIALIEAANPSLNRRQIINTIFESADNINRLNPNYLNKLGKGRLNLEVAISQAKNILDSKIEKLIVAPFSNYPSLIKITDQDGNLYNEFYAYGEKFKGGVNLAGCDINGDGSSEIITGAGPGGGPHIKIFNIKGELLGQFFAYNKNFRGGVNLTCGDINEDGMSEIITGPGSGMEPEVKTFDQKGKNLGSFMAYYTSFHGGVNLAIGDIDGDDKNEIITGAGQGGGPQIRIFKRGGFSVGQFFAYDKNFRGGVKVAVADVNGGIRSHRAEIIATPGKGGGPHLKIFDNKANLLGHFFAFNSNLRGGVNLAASDINNDGLDEIVVGASISGAPHVRVFNSDAKILGSFYAYEESFSGGVNVATLTIKK